MDEEPLKTIGLTEDANRILTDLMATEIFGEETDVAKLAIAHALSKGGAPSKAAKTNTKWAIGNFDSHGELLRVIGVFYPDQESSRCMRDLLNQGLVGLETEFCTSGSWDLLRLVSPG
jgi:hypothetical protein